MVERYCGCGSECDCLPCTYCDEGTHTGAGICDACLAGLVGASLASVQNALLSIGFIWGRKSYTWRKGTTQLVIVDDSRQYQVLPANLWLR